MKAKKIVLATIIFIAIANMSILPFACSADWATVTTITGSADQTSKTFSITSQEWRLQWSYTPDPRFPDLTFFGVLVYPEGKDAGYIDSFYVNGSTQTSGVEDINSTLGNYHLEILDANIPSYTIVVQQYGDTIAMHFGRKLWNRKFDQHSNSGIGSCNSFSCHSGSVVEEKRKSKINTTFSTAST